MVYHHANATYLTQCKTFRLRHMFAECGSMDDKTDHSFARSDALYAPLFAFPAILLEQK